jgi:hypothetical protein
MRTPKPCIETFVISTTEVRFLRAADFVFMFLHEAARRG